MPRDAWAEGRPYNVANPNFISPKLVPIDPVSLNGKPMPERRWIVPDWVPHGHTTILSGDGGVGKSLLAMQLLTACATGGEWLGERVMKCKAVGIFCEDDSDEIHRRQAAINRATGIEFSDLEDLNWVSRIGDDNFIFCTDGIKN